MQLNPTIKGAFKAPPLTKVAILSPSSDLIDPKKFDFSKISMAKLKNNCY